MYVNISNAHTKYTIIGYGYMYMDLKYDNGLEQYILCILSVKGGITMGLRIVFQRNEFSVYFSKP